MNDELYERLAAALDRLPNGFPKTPARTEMKLLQWMFQPDEALLAGHLAGTMETVDVISGRFDGDPGELEEKLADMAERSLIKCDSKGEKSKYRLSPFVVGIYEAQREKMDHEFAHLVEKYMFEGGAAGIMKPEPALHRVVPAHGTVRSEWILPYDDVRAMIQSATAFRVADCICRMQQDHIGRRCDFPLHNCMTFSDSEFTTSPDKVSEDVSREEALSILQQAEEIGLVHTVNNVMEGLGYVCNCCGCCCGMLRGIKDWGIEKSVAFANYYAAINPEQCNGCGVCIERCQVDAISENDGVALVHRERCIGCGLCVTGCPVDVPQLYRKPESEIVNPPVDFEAWEQERLRNRGLLEYRDRRMLRDG